MTRMTGVIFSDLGVASSFMAIDWVQRALRQALGFVPFPATLNVRPKAPGDSEIWRRKRAEGQGIPLRSAESGFCDATLYPVRVPAEAAEAGEAVTAAILVPAIKDYPSDKIEIVAPVRPAARARGAVALAGPRDQLVGPLDQIVDLAHRASGHSIAVSGELPLVTAAAARAWPSARAI